jgi:hypothetical protein
MAMPEKKFQQGCVSVAVFANETMVDGVMKPRKCVVAQKSYKDHSGQWKNSGSFGVNEIPKLIVALSKSHDCMTAKANAE